MLAFKQLVGDILNDIMQEYKMECVYIDNQKIIYEHKKITVKILFDQFGSYELEMIFQNKYTNTFFDSCTFLLYKKLISKSDYRAIIVNSNDGLTKFLTKFLKFLTKFLNEIINDDNIFNQMDIFIKKLTEQYNESKKTSYFKGLAYEAWGKKKYQKVIDYYSKIEEDLSQAEIKKLQYARKKCSVVLTEVFNVSSQATKNEQNNKEEPTP